MENPSPVPSPNAALRALPADLLRSRELLLDLVRKDLRVRYRYAAAGFLWAVAEPLAYMAVLTIIFQWILAPKTGSTMFGADIPYAAGLLCGLVFWQFTSSALSAATASLIDNQHLVKKVNFTREVVPLAALGYPVVTLAIGLVLLLLVHLTLGGRLGPGLVWVPVLLCLQFVVTSGLALLLSCGNARFRDVGHMVSVALVLGFYASPVFYDLDWVLAATDRIPQPLVAAYLANPMAELLEAYRQAILEGRRPDAWLFYWPATFAVLSALAGATAFRRAAPTLSDYL
jgi:lipopolysaccharide transport system permease protein